MTQNIKTLETDFKPQCLLMVDIAMRVHKRLGNGLKDILYKNAFEEELNNLNIKYQRNKKFEVNYHGLALDHKFVADFVIDEKVIFEIKSFHEDMMEEYACVFDDLVHSSPLVGLIVNFNKPLLQCKKVKLT
jgi:GxxExxY protein